jgi:hypothetical protein
MMTSEDLAITAYQAYGDAVEWKNFRGEPMPRFDELPDRIRLAWQKACEAVVPLASEWTGY